VRRSAAFLVKCGRAWRTYKPHIMETSMRALARTVRPSAFDKGQGHIPKFNAVGNRRVQIGISIDFQKIINRDIIVRAFILTNGVRSRPCLHGHDRTSEDIEGFTLHSIKLSALNIRAMFLSIITFFCFLIINRSTRNASVVSGYSSLNSRESL
jgi:hypothetical protein